MDKSCIQSVYQYMVNTGMLALYPNLANYTLILILPVSSCSCERSLPLWSLWRTHCAAPWVRTGWVISWAKMSWPCDFQLPPIHRYDAAKTEKSPFNWPSCQLTATDDHGAVLEIFANIHISYRPMLKRAQLGCIFVADSMCLSSTWLQ